MSTAAKVCGLSTEITVAAAVNGKASHIGFVFFPRSPRAITPGRAADLVRQIPSALSVCGLFVDADDRAIDQALAMVRLDVLQLHGDESPERCATLRDRTRRKIMKAIPVSADADIRAASRWFGAVDLLLFDARPAVAGSVPGGNGISFDWRLLAGREFPVPWFLAGGLTPDTVASAIRQTRPFGVDVSSGIETSPGIKDPALIGAFLDAVREVG